MVAVSKRISECGSERLRYVHQQNCGAASARNHGLRLAKGEYIQFLDSDDLLHPRKLESQVKQLDKSVEAGLSYCVSVRFTDEPDQKAPPSGLTDKPVRSLLPSVLHSRRWHTLSPLWRRSACDAIGPWHNFKHWEDWEYDCRAGIAGIKPVHCPEVLCYVRDHEGARLSSEARGDSSLAPDAEGTSLSVLSALRDAGLDSEECLNAISNRLFTAGRMYLSGGLRDDGMRCLSLAQEIGGRSIGREISSVRMLCKILGSRRGVAFAEKARFWLRGR